MLRNAAQHVSDSNQSRWTTVGAELSVIAAITCLTPWFCGGSRSVRQTSAASASSMGELMSFAMPKTLPNGHSQTAAIDYALVEAALARPASTATGFSHEPVTRQPSLLILHGIRNSQGSRDALIYAVIGLVSLTHLLSDNFGGNRIAALLDSEGRDITAYPVHGTSPGHDWLGPRAWRINKTDRDCDPRGAGRETSSSSTR